MKLESWDPEYHHLNGPPPVHSEVKFGESKPKAIISATFSSFWANRIEQLIGGATFLNNKFFSSWILGPFIHPLYVVI